MGDEFTESPELAAVEAAPNIGEDCDAGELLLVSDLVGVSVRLLRRIRRCSASISCPKPEL